MAPTVLIAGGSGYLGQFLVDRFSHDGRNVVYTYNTSIPPPFATKDDTPTAFKVDFVTGDGLDACFSYFESDNDHLDRRLDAVINCVAISQPLACEKDPEKARLINIPTKLLDALKTYKQKQERKAEMNKTSPPPPPLLIHVSTDQVYDGSKSYWKEESDQANPINEYGKSKLNAEREIQAQWAHHAILRSSLIYGPEPPAASVGRSLFLQFVDSKLASKESTSFFSDEWRSAVYVEDIICVCKLLIEASIVVSDTDNDTTNDNSSIKREIIRGVFNMGGPERLSRSDIAHLVADVRQYDPSIIVQVPSASAFRGVASPADISMDVSKLEDTLTTVLVSLEGARGGVLNCDNGGGGKNSTERFKFTRFRDALREIYNST